MDELEVEVIVTDDLKELAVAARQLKLQHQVCHFHLLRWLWWALQDLRKQLGAEHDPLIDEVRQTIHDRPAEGGLRLFELWQGLEAHRSQAESTSALYRLRLLILCLHENWDKYTLDQRRKDVSATNNGTELAIGKWRIRSHSTRGFKFWKGLEAAFLLCGNQIA